MTNTHPGEKTGARDADCIPYMFRFCVLDQGVESCPTYRSLTAVQPRLYVSVLAGSQVAELVAHIRVH